MVFAHIYHLVTLQLRSRQKLLEPKCQDRAWGKSLINWSFIDLLISSPQKFCNTQELLSRFSVTRLSDVLLSISTHTSCLLALLKVQIINSCMWQIPQYWTFTAAKQHAAEQNKEGYNFLFFVLLFDLQFFSCPWISLELNIVLSALFICLTQSYPRVSRDYHNTALNYFNSLF